ncbi:hypothetical protein NDU88_007179 [Pleurodeles waltl]|uniref:Uncharacterized protein n=1 Tax=Pleurodeles waltl TaxID=8319 RepID=A0AAV7LRA7_PLEWA|nr:hypothetical protein NDU88_007179 [Pleurodeles waltl]
MGRNKTDRPVASGSGGSCSGRTQKHPNASLAEPLAEHSQRYNDILSAVLDINTIFEPKIDTLRIDMGHLREDHNMLKEQVEATETTVCIMRPSMADATSHIKALQNEVSQLRQHAEDQEGQFRHNNIRMVGLPERKEVPSKDRYPKHSCKMLNKIMGPDICLDALNYILGVTHRTPQRKATSKVLDLALILAKSRLAKRWKSSATPPATGWLSDLRARILAEQRLKWLTCVAAPI